MEKLGDCGEAILRLPDFLIVGAMKAGTTTLFRDLALNKRIFFPVDKEPNNLSNDLVSSESGRRAYEDLFRKASVHQICGEASTAYTMLPDVTGVPLRTRMLIGKNLKIIYLVRNPVRRAISHHYHWYGAGKATADVDRELTDNAAYVNYSLYAMQIEPWIREFGPDQVKILSFEEYVADRKGTLMKVSDFLGVEPSVEEIKEQEVFNRGEDRSRHAGIAQTVRRMALYRKIIRPLLPSEVKDRLRVALMPKVPPRPGPPRADTIRYLIERFQDDCEMLAKLMGREGTLWDLAEELRAAQGKESSVHPEEDSDN